MPTGRIQLATGEIVQCRQGGRVCQESAKPPLSGDTSLHYQGTDSHQANPALQKWRETESKRVCLAAWKYLALFTL